MSLYSLKVIDSEFHSVADSLAIFRELSLRFNEVGHLSLRQADGFPTVTRQHGPLSQRFRFGILARFEKLAPFVECTKIKNEFEFWVVAIR